MNRLDPHGPVAIEYLSIATAKMGAREGASS